MFSLIRLVVFTRWGRLLIALLLLGAAVATAITAFAVTNIHMTSGTAATLADVVDEQSNQYQHSELTLAGASATYEFDRPAFTPALDENSFIKGGKVDLWYVQTPLNNPSIVALQIYDEQGANPTKYVTDGYTNPEDARNGDLIPTAIFLVLGLAMVAVAFFVPTAVRSPANRPPTGGYGASVLSAGQRPRAPAQKPDGR